MTDKSIYNDAKDSVFRVREEDEERVLPTCKERFEKIMKNMRERKAGVDEQEQLLKLMNYFSEREQQKVKKKIEDERDDKER